MRSFCTVALLCLIVGCGGSPDKPGDEASGGAGKAAAGASVAVDGGSSPEDVFDKIKGDFESKDYAAAFKCMAPESRDGMLFVTMMIVGMATMGNEDAATEAEAILKKHGVDVEKGQNINLGDEAAAKKALAEAFKNVKDKPALFEELMKSVEKHSDKMDSPVPTSAQLTNVKIEGDTATGTISSEGKERDVKFVKVDGRWYVSLE